METKWTIVTMIDSNKIHCFDVTGTKRNALTSVGNIAVVIGTANVNVHILETIAEHANSCETEDFIERMF